MVYKWHVSCQLGDGLRYRSHLLGEPETTIDNRHIPWRKNQPQGILKLHQLRLEISREKLPGKNPLVNGRSWLENHYL